jgi:predicted XRE-type DNA-binding protein
MVQKSLKPVRWVSPSYEALVALPRDVQHAVGLALMMAQSGGKHPSAKPLKGFKGAGVLEIIEDHNGDTPGGVHGPIRRRHLRVARVPEEVEEAHRDPKARNRPDQEPTEDGRAGLPRARGGRMSTEMKVTPADGNIFETLGFPDAEELKAKAELVIQIIQIMEERGLKQVEAAEIMGIDQPKVSQLVHGRLDGFSMERLYRFLNALGMDVEIVVKPVPKSRGSARLSVTRAGARSRGRRTAKV